MFHSLPHFLTPTQTSPPERTAPDSLRQGASQAAGAAPTLRYGPAGDSRTSLLRLKATGMAERFPSARQARPECPRFGAWCDAIERRCYLLMSPWR